MYFAVIQYIEGNVVFGTNGTSGLAGWLVDSAGIAVVSLTFGDVCTSQFPEEIVFCMKSMYLKTLVYEPGALCLAQSTPQLTMPTTSMLPLVAIPTKGPPESP